MGYLLMLFAGAIAGYITRQYLSAEELRFAAWLKAENARLAAAVKALEAKLKELEPKL